MNRRLLLLFTVLSIIQVSSASAQLNQVMDLSYYDRSDHIQCKIVCSRKVPFGSIWLPEENRLVVYLRESSWGGPSIPINPQEGPVSNFFGQQSSENPGVVEVMMDFRTNPKYDINYNGNDIVISIKNEAVGNQLASAGKDRRNNEIDKKSPMQSSYRVNMDYREAEIPNVLRLIAQQNHVNIVAGSEVEGTITISLRNVTLKEALDNILIANGFDYIVDENVILVKKRDTFIPTKSITKVYRLKYIDAQNLKSVIKDMVSEKAKIEVLAEDFYTYDKPDEKAEKSPIPGLSPQSKGKDSKEKRRSSVLVVTETPEHIRKIDEVVEQLDVATPQILIESKLVELSPLDRSNIGIDWDKAITATLLNQDVLPLGDLQDYSVIKNDLNSPAPWVLGHLTASQFSSVLNYLRENTESKLISNPKILAMDNQTSKISVGTTYPIPQINRGVGGQGDVVTFLYKDVDIELNVTPHVINGEEILMYVNPLIEEITGQVKIDINSAPITSKRAVNTVVSVSDGETVVIGGMIKEDLKKTTSKVWLLGDIPILGGLFRSTSFEKRQSDLLIFITPHILR